MYTEIPVVKKAVRAPDPIFNIGKLELTACKDGTFLFHCKRDSGFQGMCRSSARELQTFLVNNL